MKFGMVGLLALLAVSCGPPAQVAGPSPAPRTAVPPAATLAPTTVMATPTVAPATRTPVPATVTALPPVPTATAQRQVASPTSPAAAPAGVPSATATIRTSTGSVATVRLEIAGTPEERSRGLSRRPSLPEDAGMLFIFPGDEQVPFWMKDTLIPLSIAFIAADGRIVDIQDMQPLTEDLHRPSRPYRYALEVNQGFFKRSGVAVGDRVEFRLGGG